MRNIELEECTVTVEAFEEEEHWTSKAHGLDPQVQQVVADMADAHGLWGWCGVKVTVRWNEAPNMFDADYLGACSHAGEADLIANSGYYEDMVRSALEGLNSKVRHHISEAVKLRQILETPLSRSASIPAT